MIYNLDNELELKEAREYLTKLLSRKAVIEIKQKHKPRTTNQNSYTHLLLSYCASEFGSSLEWFKLNIFKIYINRDLFVSDYIDAKTEISLKQIRSTSDLTTDEMAVAIERLKRFALDKMSIELPDSEDYNNLNKISNQIEKNRNYL